MKILLNITCSACFLLIGCVDTEGTLDIRGKVLDEYTKECIPNRKVIIKGLVYSDSKLPYCDSRLTPTDVGQFYTDSSGHFSYTMKKTKGAYSYYFIFVGDSAYAFSTQEVFLTNLETNSKYLSFTICKLTDFTIKIERCSKTPLFDTLYVSWKTYGFDGRTIYPYKLLNYGIEPNFAFKWIGGNVKSVIQTKVFANKKTILCLELFRNGKKKEISDTIYCERDVNNNFSFRY